MRRILSLFLFLAALGCIGAFIPLFSVRYWGEQGEVSQVFQLNRAVALGENDFIGVYSVAITPKEETAQICDLVAWTPKRYVNMLDRLVWLWPVDKPVFAYDESPQSRTMMWAALVCGIFLPILAYYLWQKSE